MKKVILLFLVAIFLISFVNAQSTQYSKLFFSPFYRSSMSQNINYSYTLNIERPVNTLINVQSAIISFDVYISPTVTFNLWVNNKSCNNPSYTISTTYASAGQSRITFDCSNIIKHAGIYEVILKPTLQNTGAITGWADISYSSIPQGDMTIHGTEYTNKQNVKTWLQLLDANGTAITGGVCYVDVYNPDNTDYVERATMTNMNHDGIFYKDFSVGSFKKEGVYPVLALCYYQSGQTSNFAGSYFIQIGVYTSGSVADTQVVDGTILRLTEVAVNRNITAGLNFTTGNICVNISEELLTGITFRTVTKFDSVVNDDITLSIWNYTSSSWIDLPNKVLEGNVFRDVSNSIALTNITKAGFVNASGSNLRIRYKDASLTDGAISNLDIDYADIMCDSLSSPVWQEVKGSSEIHISPTTDNTFYVETLCGSSDEALDTSACSVFKNDLEVSNTTWGYIEDDLTFINSYETNVLSTYYYETPLSQDCTGILDIVQTRDGSSYSILDNVTTISGLKDNCIIGISVTFNSSDREFFVNITQENYMVWEFQRDNDFVNYYDLVITPLCNQLAYVNSKPYILPIDAGLDVSSVYASNPIYLGCYRMMDDLYWWDYYFNASKSITTTGEYGSYLLSAKYYYPEIKSSSTLVQALNYENALLDVHSSCGIGFEGYECATIKTPDSYFTSQEGYVLENLTIVNDFNTTAIMVYQYETAFAMDCTSVIEIIKQNDTTTDITPYASFKQGSKDNCLITLPINYVEGQPSYNILIYMENYIMWDILWARDNVNLWNESIVDFCDAVALNSSITYSLPINQSIDMYLSNPELYSCYRAMDDLYWWNFYWQDRIDSGITQVGGLESYHYESEFFWIRILEDYNTIKTYQRNSNQILILDFLQEAKDNAHLRVWNYTNRSITNQVIINETSLISSIASAIWGWTGSISSTITNTFSSVFWSNANYSEVARYVWEYNNRSLTFYQVNNISVSDIFNYLNGSLTIVDNYNYSKSAEMTWNFIDRNLTLYPVGNNITAQDIWSFYNRSLSDNGVLQIWGMNNISADVWSYQNRTLTYYTINLTELIGMISNYTSGDMGYTLLPPQQSYQLTGNLNVILVSPQYIGK